MEYKVIDDSGQVIGYIREGDRVVRKESVESVNGTVAWTPEESFGKFYPEAMKRLSKLGCTAAEYRLLFLVLGYISYKSGLLMHDNGRSLTAEWITEQMDMNKDVVYRTIRSLIAKGILYKGSGNKGKVDEYFINPFYFFKGNRINQTLLAMFSDPKDRVK
jgi:hypothetical protein